MIFVDDKNISEYKNINEEVLGFSLLGYKMLTIVHCLILAFTIFGKCSDFVRLVKLHVSDTLHAFWKQAAVRSHLIIYLLILFSPDVSSANCIVEKIY